VSLTCKVSPSHFIYPPSPPQGGFWYRLLCILAYCSSFVAFGLELNIVGPTLHDLASRTQLSEADLGIIFTVTGLLSSLGAIPAGWLVDRLPGHMVLAGSLMFQVCVGGEIVEGRHTCVHVLSIWADLRGKEIAACMCGHVRLQWRANKGVVC